MAKGNDMLVSRHTAFLGAFVVAVPYANMLACVPQALVFRLTKWPIEKTTLLCKFGIHHPNVFVEVLLPIAQRHGHATISVLIMGAVDVRTFVIYHHGPTSKATVFHTAKAAEDAVIDLVMGMFVVIHIPTDNHAKVGV